MANYLQTFCPDPMSAPQMHGFLVGLLSGPSRPDDASWIDELHYRSNQGDSPSPSIESATGVESFLNTARQAYTLAIRELTGGNVASEYRFISEDVTLSEKDVGNARAFAAGFIRGFAYSGGMADEARLNEEATRAFAVMYALAYPERTDELFEDAEGTPDLSVTTLAPVIPAAVITLAIAGRGWSNPEE